MNNNFFQNKETVIFLTILMTAGLIFFSIPTFPDNKEINNLLTRFQNSIFWKEDEKEEEPDIEEEKEPEEDQKEEDPESNEANSDSLDKIEKILKVTFENNGAISVSKTTVSCTTKTESCKITLPKINSDKTVLGWSTKEDAKTPIYKVGERIEIKENMTLFAITVKKVEVTIEGNDVFEGIEKKECSYYNKEKSCSITLPKLEKENVTEIGFSKKKDSKEISYRPNSRITLSENATLYVIRK